MHTGITIFGIIVFLLGKLVGMAGVAGLVLAFSGEPTGSYLWGSIGLGAGVAICMAGIFLAMWSYNRMSVFGRRLLGCSLGVPVGLFLLYAGLGVTGLISRTPLDVFGAFKYVSAHPIGYLLVLAGLGIAFLAGSLPFRPREAIAAHRV